jgi:hypothetical protein
LLITVKLALRSAKRSFSHVSMVPRRNVFDLVREHREGREAFGGHR